MAKSDAFIAQAHREKADLFLEKVRPIIVAADPISLWLSSRTTPIAVDTRTAFAWPHERVDSETVAALIRESSQIETKYLAPDKAVFVQTASNVLMRWKRGQEEAGVERYDPAYAIRRFAVAIEELEHRWIRDGIEPRDLDLISELCTAFAPLPLRWPAISTAALEKAQALATSLRRQVSSFAEQARRNTSTDSSGKVLAERLDAVALAIDQHSVRLATLDAELKKIAAIAPNHALPVRQLGQMPVRMEPRPLAAQMLLSLNTSEMINDSTADLAAKANRALDRLVLMREQAPMAADPEKRNVDAARCQSIWQPLAQWRTTMGVWKNELKCERVAQHFDGTVVDDHELFFYLVDVGLTEPEFENFRQTQEPLLANTQGEVLPLASRIFRRIMVAHAARPQSAKEAIDESIRWLCQSASWLSGGDKPTPSQSRLTSYCASVARPRFAVPMPLGDEIAGAGVAFIPDQPHQMAVLDHFSWAPQGLLSLWATPKGIHPSTYAELDAEVMRQGDAPPPKVEVERFDGSESSAAKP
jgi:hypothetical protein